MPLVLLLRAVLDNGLVSFPVIAADPSAGAPA